MKRKALSLLLALALCLGLTIPASAAAYEYSNGKCTYELSNEPIGTVEMREPTFEEATTVLVVPDNTTVVSKTVPDGRLVFHVRIYGQGSYLIDWNEVGNPFVVAPFYERDDGSTFVYQVWSENREYTDPVPDALDFDEGGVPVMAQSAAVAAGLTVRPISAAPVAPAAPAAPTSPTKFTDVAASSPFVDAINWAVEKNITTGKTDTTFAPGEECTNGQILTFLWRANGSPEPTVDNPFTDSIPASFQKAAVWAYEKGLVSGAVFGASTPCTRAVTVEYLWKAAGSPAIAENASFADVPANADYAQAVAWAVENGVTSGTGNGQFSPANTCTRGQIVTFLYRAMGK